MVSATHIGNTPSHLRLTWDLTAEKPSTAASSSFNLLTPTQGPAYGVVDLADDGANANYNGVLLTVQHRFSHNFTRFANYTYSHCLGDGDFNGDLRGSYYQDPFDRALD